MEIPATLPKNKTDDVIHSNDIDRLTPEGVEERINEGYDIDPDEERGLFDRVNLALANEGRPTIGVRRGLVVSMKQGDSLIPGVVVGAGLHKKTKKHMILVVPVSVDAEGGFTSYSGNGNTL